MATPQERPLENEKFSVVLRLIGSFGDRPIVDETGLKGNHEMANINLGEVTQQ
jgi:hypothetical protein